MYFLNYFNILLLVSSLLKSILLQPCLKILFYCSCSVGFVETTLLGSLGLCTIHCFDYTQLQWLSSHDTSVPVYLCGLFLFYHKVKTTVIQSCKLKQSLNKTIASPVWWLCVLYTGLRHVFPSPLPLPTALLVCKATYLNVLFVFCFSPEGSVTSPIFLTYLLLESLKPEWTHFSTY